MASFPAVFVSHGSPMIAIQGSQARDFLAGFGRELGRPQAILVCSAHFEARAPLLTADAQPEMIYDFGGFPRALFEMRYPAPGSPELAGRAADLLAGAGVAARTATGRGFDHGTWVPLSLMYPDADIPVVQISVEPQRDAAYHIALGRALAPLREAGVLLMGSGSLTHNLYELRRDGADAPAPHWVRAFADWAHAAIEAGRAEEVADWTVRAPYARENHPTPEHFLPLPFAIGAAGADARGCRVHTSSEYGVLMMDAYRFG